ncbi:MAG: type II toxin-antitoxin system CcdA family antitoxin [Acidimicrobiia bacterium]|nr:type II toxin-antitoxin system CcdA family antitoxin [Acidimicrobiia bacterium]
MARVNVYLPDELAEEVKAADLNVSSIAQAALRGALDADRTDAWLDGLARMPRSGVTAEAAAGAIEEAKAEFERA